MPTSTYIALANYTATGTINEVNFSSIPGTYRDLILIAHCAGSGYFSLQYNSDTGSNYPFNAFWGSGSGGGSAQQSATFTRVGMTYPLTSSMENPIIFNIMDYSANNKHKVTLYRGNSVSAGVWVGSSRWASNNPITSIKVFCDNGNISAGSTLALYGIVS